MTTLNTSIVRIPLTKPANKFIILKSTWSKTPFQFDMMLLNASNPSIASAEEFTGTFSMNQIEAMAIGLDKTVDDMLNVTKSVLSTDNGSSNFSYVLDSHQFQWYADGVLKYGTIDLNPTYNIGIDLMLTLLQLKSEYKTNLELTATKLTATHQHHEQIKEVYEQFVADQVANEERMLTTFLALLNEKKAKICQLENLLSQVQCDGNDDEPMDTFDAQTHLTGQKRSVDDESEKQLNEPSTSGGTNLRKRKPINRNRTETTAVVSAANQLSKTTDASSVTNSMRMTDVAATKSTEDDNNVTQDSIYSKNTEELCADM